MDEFAIREVCGVAASNVEFSRRVLITEKDAEVFLEITNTQHSALLSPDAARRLAARLYRLARRIDLRNA